MLPSATTAMHQLAQQPGFIPDAEMANLQPAEHSRPAYVLAMYGCTFVYQQQRFLASWCTSARALMHTPSQRVAYGCMKRMPEIAGTTITRKALLECGSTQWQQSAAHLQLQFPQPHLSGCLLSTWLLEEANRGSQLSRLSARCFFLLCCGRND